MEKNEKNEHKKTPLPIYLPSQQALHTAINPLSHSSTHLSIHTPNLTITYLPIHLLATPKFYLSQLTNFLRNSSTNPITNPPNPPFPTHKLLPTHHTREAVSTSLWLPKGARGDSPKRVFVRMTLEKHNNILENHEASGCL